MKPNIFAGNIAKLNAFYVNFKLDTGNELVMDVWYNYFKGMQDHDFTNLVNDYMIHNIYPPQSPAHLMEHYRKKLIESQTSAETAWNDLLELRQRSAFKEYSAVMGVRYLIDEMVEYYNDNGKQAVARTIERLKDDLRFGLDGNKGTWVKKSFIDVYNQEIRLAVNDKALGIVAPNHTKLIGETENE